MAKITVKGIWEVLKKSFSGFSDDKVPKLSASLAYYTVFSMGPLLIVIIYLCGLFFGQEAIEGTIYKQMESFVGHDAALQIQQIIKNASVQGKGSIAAIIGVITLLIGATTVFAEIQDSINMIWGLKPKPKKSGILMMIKNRVLSFSVIISLGFLLLVSLAVTSVIEALGNRLQQAFPDVTVVVFYIINLIVTLAVITSLFAVIFKVLPDAEIKWKDVFAGAVTTAILFMLGKFAISFYIGQSNIGGTYGAAGSLVVLILWIYFSSMILYFGAEFTKAYALKYGSEIHPNAYAVTMKVVQVETGGDSVQKKEQHKETLHGPQELHKLHSGHRDTADNKKEQQPHSQPQPQPTPQYKGMPKIEVADKKSFIENFRKPKAQSGSKAKITDVIPALGMMVLFEFIQSLKSRRTE